MDESPAKQYGVAEMIDVTLMNQLIREYRRRVAKLNGCSKRSSRTLIEEMAKTHNLKIASWEGAMNWGVLIAADFVMKIVDEYDEAYAFLQAVREKRLRSRFYPKLYAFVKTPETTQAIVIMERLKPFDSDAEARATADHIRYDMRSDQSKASDASISAFHKIFKKNGRGGHDCHSKNIMLRNDGTLVLVDPVA